MTGEVEGRNHIMRRLLGKTKPAGAALTMPSERNYRLEQLCRDLVARHDVLKRENTLTGDYGQDINLAMIIEDIRAELKAKA